MLDLSQRPNQSETLAISPFCYEKAIGMRPVCRLFVKRPYETQ
jgi:hypothetical protein